jgi:multicomponent Na+:H+ antiporter subunit D
MSLAEHLPALQIVAPLLTAALVALLRQPLLAWAAACAASLLSFGIAALLTAAVLEHGVLSYAMGSWEPPYGIELRVDQFSVILLLLVTGSSSLALLAGRTSLLQEIVGERAPLFFAAWLIVMAGLCGIAATGDAFNVFVFMEISSLASYVLIACGKDRRALTAAFKYLIIGTIGATFYLIGVGLVYMMTGTLNFADMEARIALVSDQSPILVAAGFITVGLALKAAVFPLHVWLPNAYTYAPHAVTAFIAASSTKVSVYVLLRFDFLVFQGNLLGHAEQFAGFLIPLAALGILVASAVAMVESNLKRLLAYSSIAQIGYILLGAGMVSQSGLSAAILHVFNHGLAKGALFLAVIALGMRLRSLDLRDLDGIGRRMPWTMACFVIAALSLIGVPGTAGFISKWYLLSAAFDEGRIGLLLAGVIILSSLMCVVYLWRVIEPACMRSPSGEAANATEAPRDVLAVLGLAVALNLYFGIFADLPVTLADAAATELLRNLR